MAEKDASEKILESYNDVFSDIVNVLLFQGRQVLAPNELEDQAPRSYYKTDGRLHEIERDVAKRWKNGNIRVACIGFENQTASDPDMPLRVMGYDGAEYRAQLLGENGRVLSLIKPQFEAGPRALGKRGVVGDARVHEQVLAQLCEFVPTLGWRVRALDFSPVCGGDGNLEFLADLVPSNGTAQPFVDRGEIHRLVAQAHREIR